MIDVVIADDHSLIREGFKKILDQEIDLKVVGEAQNSDQVLKFLSQNKCDILVLDITMPGKNGMELLQELVDMYPKLKILMLSMHPAERFAVRSLKIGAKGYLTKESAVEQIVQAIRTIHSGKRYISQEIVDTFIIGLEEEKKHASDLLTNREFQIFLKLTSGKSVTETSKELALSQSTINTYRTRILEKLQLKTTIDLIHYAIKNQYIE